MIRQLFRISFIILIVSAVVVVGLKMDIDRSFERMQNPLEESDHIDIQIAENAQKTLKECLSKSPIQKKYVDVNIKIDEEYYKAKLKFHGTSALHYVNNKYSYTVKLHSKSPSMNGWRSFKLIKSEEQSPGVMLVNNMAREEGFIAPNGKMVNLRINGESVGAYAMVEYQTSPKLLADFGIERYSYLRTINDTRRKETAQTGDPHRSQFDFHYQNIKTKPGAEFPVALNQYRIFTDAVERHDINYIKSKIDLEEWAKFFAFQSLFNDIHFTSGHNARMIYDLDRDKFHFLYRQESPYRKWYTMGSTQEDIFFNNFVNYNRILFHSQPMLEGAKHQQIHMLLLSDPQFRNLRDQYLWEYLNERKTFVQRIAIGQEKFERIVIASNRDPEEWETEKTEQIELVNAMFDLADEYLNHSFVRMTYDKNNHQLHVLSDCFVPISAMHPAFTNVTEVIPGLAFNEELRHHGENYIIDIRPNVNFDPSTCVFKNTITHEIIPKDRISLNHIDFSPIASDTLVVYE